MCNFFSLFYHNDEITIEILDNANKKMLVNYVKCRKSEIAYWSIKDPKYSDFLSIQPYNVCNKSFYSVLVQYANMIRNIKPLMTNQDICISILLAFYNISLYETQEYIHHKRLLNIVNNPIHVQDLYYEICGVSVISTNPDHWSDDNYSDCEDSLIDQNPMYSNEVKTLKQYDNIIYQKLRHFMITGKTHELTPVI